MVMDIDEKLISDIKAMRMADFPTIGWDNNDGRVTLAEDSCHPITMFRGEGANHGISDAALLVDQLKKIKDGLVSQKEGLNAYEAEMIPRGHSAVLLSRQAALDAHNWGDLSVKSPSVSARVSPTTAH